MTNQLQNGSDSSCTLITIRDIIVVTVGTKKTSLCLVLIYREGINSGKIFPSVYLGKIPNLKPNRQIQLTTV